MSFKFSYKVLNLYMYLPVIALLAGLYIVFFAEDKFRYECQDPAMWEDPWCNPPLCLSVGACTSDLISLDGNYTNRYQSQNNQFMSTPAEDPVEEQPVESYDSQCDCNTYDSESTELEQINQLIEEIKANE